MSSDSASLFAAQLRYRALRLREVGVRALPALYDLIGPRLYRFALAICRNPHDAEDALQQAVVRIAQYPESVAQATQPWAYCLTIVRNEVLRVARKRPLTVVVAESARQVEAGAYSEISAEETSGQVRAALETLPPSQAEVVVLKIWEQMTFGEIAEVLGESPNTVASRYRYAMEKLESRLKPLHDELMNRESCRA
ncbi:MAG: sigma-70 family RNA polymerase sigma factor [Planctomycetaceae bacterium]|mgnify:CR=1 FL=1|nr:sigma-70 family RNA polymerase sigma factor [Planctomycetaceae bacterium]